VPDPPDEELVRRCQAGQRRAFRQLVERYQRKVYGIAWSFVRNRDDAMDLTQEVFLKVHRNLDGFHGSARFYTWLYRIAVNVCIDHLRRRRRARDEAEYDDRLDHDEASETDGDALVGRHPAANPERAARVAELARRVQQAMAGLSDAHREILVLREIEGLSYEELAEVLQIPKGTVMSRLHHARRNVRKQLGDFLQEGV